MQREGIFVIPYPSCTLALPCCLPDPFLDPTGYSLGGLIARYAVGRMEQEGIFVSPDAPSTSGRFEAVNFTTIATPHLGAWRAPPKR